MTTSSWDTVWLNAAAAAHVPLDAATLENHIDSGKIGFILPWIPGEGCAVEIGCGSARLLARLGITRPYTLTAVDTSLEALAGVERTAAAAGLAIRAVCADAYRLPIKSGSCDVVLSGGLLEHFRDPLPILREMVRVLKPGGVFYADVVPRKFSLYRVGEVMRMMRSEWLLPGVVETRHDGAYYRGHLTGLGCSEVSYRYCGVYPPRVSHEVGKRTAVLDGTPVARAFGWYFMIRGRKA